MDPTQNNKHLLNQSSFQSINDDLDIRPKFSQVDDKNEEHDLSELVPPFSTSRQIDNQMLDIKENEKLHGILPPILQ